jgi:hypothetical protein
MVESLTFARFARYPQGARGMLDLSLLADILPPPPPGEPWNSPAFVFLLTVALEWPVLAWWSGLGFRRTAIFVVLVNGLTWGVAMGVRARWPVPLPLLEAAIITAESALLAAWWRWSWQKAFPISLGMNLASWLLGTALLALLLHQT